MVSSECATTCFGDLISQSSRRNAVAGKSKTKRIVFIWSVRDPSTRFAFLIMTSAYRRCRVHPLDLRNSWRCDKVGSPRPPDFHPDLPDRKVFLSAMGLGRLGRVLQGKGRTTRGEPYPIVARRPRGPDHQRISTRPETHTPRSGGFDRWANGSNRFVLPVANGSEFWFLIVILPRSMRFSIYHCRRQRCPRIFNRWPIQHHEGWSQYHPQH